MKKRNSYDHLSLILLSVLVCAACNKQPTPNIQFESGSICVVGPDGKKNCQPVDGNNMVALHKDGKAVQLTPIQAPAAGNPNFPAHEGELAYLHQTLSAHGMTFDFDPQKTSMDWEGTALDLKDIASGKILLHLPNADSGQVICLPSSDNQKLSIAAITSVTCKFQSITVIDSFPTSESVLLLCGKTDSECSSIGEIDQFGPVIVVQVDNIISDEPAPNRLASWKDWLKQVQELKIGPNQMIDFRLLDPLGGDHPQTHPDTSQIRPLSISDGHLASREGDFQLVFRTAEEGLQLHACQGYVYFEFKEETLATLTATRLIVIRKDCENRCFGIYAQRTDAAYDWVNHNSRYITEIGPHF